MALTSRSRVPPPIQTHFGMRAGAAMQNFPNASRRLVLQLGSVDGLQSPVPGLRTLHAWDLSGCGRCHFGHRGKGVGLLGY